MPLNQGKCCSSIVLSSLISQHGAQQQPYVPSGLQEAMGIKETEQNAATVKGEWAGCFCCCCTYQNPQHSLNHTQSKMCSLVWEADFCLLKLPCASHPECWAFLLKNITSLYTAYRREDLIYISSCQKSCSKYSWYEHVPNQCRVTGDTGTELADLLSALNSSSYPLIYVNAEKEEGSSFLILIFSLYR